MNLMDGFPTPRLLLKMPLALNSVSKPTPSPHAANRVFPAWHWNPLCTAPHVQNAHWAVRGNHVPYAILHCDWRAIRVPVIQASSETHQPFYTIHFCLTSYRKQSLSSPHPKHSPAELFVSTPPSPLTHKHTHTKWEKKYLEVYYYICINMLISHFQRTLKCYYFADYAL